MNHTHHHDKTLLRASYAVSEGLGAENHRFFLAFGQIGRCFSVEEICTISVKSEG